MTREQLLGRTFVELADTLVDDFDVVDLTILLTERCVELLDASAAGLLLANGRGSLNLMAATSEATEVVELFQIQSDEGPCRDCFHAGAPVSVRDLRDETDRWPRFAPVAIGAGFAPPPPSRCGCAARCSAPSTSLAPSRWRSSEEISRPPRPSPTSPASA